MTSTGPRTGRWPALAVVLAVLFAACGPTESGERRIVVSTTILGDVVAAVAGDRFEVEVLIEVGVDPHDFEPSAAQRAAMVQAELIVVNGLGLEERLDDSVSSAAEDGATVLAVGPALRPIPLEGNPAAADPHVWMDPLRVAEAAELIARQLALADPDGADLYEGNAARYRDRLEQLDAEIAGLVAGLAADERVLVTNHDSLRYFADRYGFEVVGVVIPGGSTLAEPSPFDLAELIAIIELTGVRAIFAETTSASDLAAAVGADAGEVAVVELFTGSLGGPGSGAETYVEMLWFDAQAIVTALRG